MTEPRSRRFPSVVVLAAILMLLGAAPDAFADRARNQDPGSGGGGGQSYCWTQSCAYCDEPCNAYGCWVSCEYDEWPGGCACWFENGECSENGSCTYVP